MLRTAISATVVLILALTAPGQERKPDAAKQDPPAGAAAAGEGKSQPAPLDEPITGLAAARIIRGNRYMQFQLYDQAIAEFKMAIAASKKPLRTAYANLGAAYSGKHEYRAAVDAYRQALEIAPGDFVLRYQLGDALYFSGEYREAEAEYRKVLAATARGNPAGHHALGLALFAQKRVDEAAAEYRIAIEQAKGNYAEAHYNFGIALFAQGDGKAAETEFRTAIAQEKKDWPEAHFNLAQALEKQNRFGDAAAEYETYLRLAPTAEDAAKLRAYIEYLKKRT